MDTRPRVLLSDPIHAAGTALLEEHCRLVYGESVADFVEKAHEAEALVLVRNGQALRDTIEGAAHLRVIAKHGVGLDKIDLRAARQRNIPVVYTPNSNSISVAEHFITLCLMLAKRMHLGDMALRDRKWKFDPFDFLGSELYGKSVGIMGFGRIGRQVARICREGFDMRVLYYDLVDRGEAEREFDAELVEPKTLFAQSDYISINLPLTPQTRGMVNADLLRNMKSSAYVINVARGPIWSEDDLLMALTEGWIAGAASDVFESEPTPEDNPLFDLGNFISTPHLAAHTEEGMRRAGLMLASDVISVLDGKTPKYPVPTEMYSASAESDGGA